MPFLIKVAKMLTFCKHESLKIPTGTCICFEQHERLQINNSEATKQANRKVDV